MAERAKGRRTGWVAPKSGGYSFGSSRSSTTGRHTEAKPPPGSGGAGNLRQKKTKDTKA